MMPRSLIAVFLLMNFSHAEAWEDGKFCYILDGILFLYGMVLTVLYCRLRMQPVYLHPTVYSEKQVPSGGIYAGLSSHSKDIYESIKVEKA